MGHTFSYSFFIPHQERRKPEGGCEKFVFTAIWQKVLRQQALTLSFQTHWEAALVLIKVFLLMSMLVLHFNFYLENQQSAIFRVEIFSVILCIHKIWQRLQNIPAETRRLAKYSGFAWTQNNKREDHSHRFHILSAHSVLGLHLTPESTLLWIWSVCLKISDWTAWPQRGAAGQCKHWTERTPPFLSTSSLSISPL